MASYTVGNSLTLMCMLDSSVINTTSRNVTYSWQCHECFANGVFNMSVTRDLTDMDSSTISCTYNVDGDMFTTSLDLQVTGDY